MSPHVPEALSPKMAFFLVDLEFREKARNLLTTREVRVVLCISALELIFSAFNLLLDLLVPTSFVP